MLVDGVYVMYMKFEFPIHVMHESTFHNFIHKKAKGLRRIVSGRRDVTSTSFPQNEEEAKPKVYPSNQWTK